jgi:cell wall-associated NlpC family hydrolase
MSRRCGLIGIGGLIAGIALAGLLAALLVTLVTVVRPACGPAVSAPPDGRAGSPPGGQGGSAASSGPGASISLAAPGGGVTVGATEYGGPGDPSSGSIGASGANLLAHPDTYAELGGYSFQTATAMGGLPYMTPLRVTWPAESGRSVIAYKRDFGFGGGPVDGLPRVIDLWWELAGRLGIPYERGLWSGPVRIERPPGTGAGNVLGQTPASADSPADGWAAGSSGAAECPAALIGGVPLTPGPRATLLRDGLAAAPVSAPAAVKGMVAAGNQIAGKPYVYGGGHGLPLSAIAPAYDCSSSVSHLLYGGGLLSAAGDATSGEYMSWGMAGPGRWVTIYANFDHVFMYVAGLRWDTHDAAGPGDGSAGIGWHPLIRSSAGFVVRHPAGL